MNKVKIKFNYPIPDEYLKQSFDKGLTAPWEYIGDDVFYLQFDSDTGLQLGAPLSIDMVNDGRKCPKDVIWYKVIAKNEPLLSYLCRPPLWEESEYDIARDNAKVITLAEFDGYEKLTRQEGYEPSDVFNSVFHYNAKTKQIEFEPFTYRDILYLEGGQNIDWDYVIQLRNSSLISSDGMESGDMPESMVTKIREYRQLLRDLPKKLKHIEPWQVIHMFPKLEL